MANAANTRNVRNSKSRQYAQDRNKFGGSSAPKKDSPNYADKSMRSSADSSGQPKGYSVESKTTPKPKPDYSDRTLRSSSDSSGQPKNYSSESASKAQNTVLQDSLFNTSVELGRYQMTLEMLKDGDMKTANKFEYILTTQTE